MTMHSVQPVRALALSPTLTSAGHELLAAALTVMLRAQERMLRPLPKAERAEFLRRPGVLVTANNELSRAPSEAA